MKENKIIDPFDDGMDACAFQQFNTCICDGSLDASGSSKTFNGDMLNVDVVVPHHRKIGLVGGSNGGIMVSFGNIERQLEFQADSEIPWKDRLVMVVQMGSTDANNTGNKRYRKQRAPMPSNVKQ